MTLQAAFESPEILPKWCGDDDKTKAYLQVKSELLGDLHNDLLLRMTESTRKLEAVPTLPDEEINEENEDEYVPTSDEAFVVKMVATNLAAIKKLQTTRDEMIMDRDLYLAAELVATNETFSLQIHLQAFFAPRAEIMSKYDTDNNWIDVKAFRIYNDFCVSLHAILPPCITCLLLFSHFFTFFFHGVFSHFQLSKLPNFL